MKQVNFAVAAVFGALGILLLVSARSFPPGMGRLPGPGFFPGVIGVVITALALLLVVAAPRQAPRAVPAGGGLRRAAVSVALILVYLGLWNSVPFAVRTPVLLLLFLRWNGERWRPALAVSAVLTAAVLLVFQYGLRVDLG